jgi:c-di-GMP-binding flagellar brake protein YcgR
MSDAPTTPDIAAALQEDRRLEDRHLVHWPVALGWTTAAGQQVAHGRTIDLSSSGARVAVDRNFTIGAKLMCRLSIHPWHGNNARFEVDMTTKVVHCAYSSESDGFDVGLQFIEFSGDGKERFAKAVQAL